MKSKQTIWHLHPGRSLRPTWAIEDSNFFSQSSASSYTDPFFTTSCQKFMSLAIASEEDEESKASEDRPMQVTQFSFGVFQHESGPSFPFFDAFFDSDASFLMDSDAPSLPGCIKASAESPMPCSFRKEDIILGRGAQYSQNPGNRRFYQALDHSIPLYYAAETKHEKSAVVLGIFQQLSSENKRFMKKNEDDGTFSQINDKDARQKISHALRYRKQNKSDSSVYSMTVKETRKMAPRAHSASPNIEDDDSSKMPYTPSARGKPKRDINDTPGSPSMFSEEDLDNVAPLGSDLPSSLALFHFYSQQLDDRSAENDRAEGFDDDYFPL